MSSIKKCLYNKEPVIALIGWKWDNLHYVNIIGISNQGDVAILDINNTIFYYTKNAFYDLFYLSSYSLVKYAYNLICFYKLTPVSELIDTIKQGLIKRIEEMKKEEEKRKEKEK